MYENLTSRELQVLAALCLSKFCKHFGIDHEALSSLISHECSILIAKDLSSWDAAGANLYLPGRGDPVPADILHLVPDLIKKDFTELVECSVEVGIIDLYGADTKMPRDFLLRCTHILNRNNIPFL
jgi:hypothetical protein